MNNIKKIRKEKNISVTELANLLGMSQSNLTKIENNQVELKKELANKIAEVLKVSINSITNEKQEGIELINPEIYNLLPHTHWNIPPQIKAFSTTKGYIMPDDTMQPTLLKHSIAIIDDIKTPITNGIYLISYNNQTILRRLQIIDNKNIKIITDNTAYPPLQTFIENIKIIGKATNTISYNSL